MSVGGGKYVTDRGLNTFKEKIQGKERGGKIKIKLKTSPD